MGYVSAYQERGKLGRVWIVRLLLSTTILGTPLVRGGELLSTPRVDGSCKR